MLLLSTCEGIHRLSRLNRTLALLLVVSSDASIYAAIDREIADEACSIESRACRAIDLAKNLRDAKLTDMLYDLCGEEPNLDCIFDHVAKMRTAASKQEILIIQCPLGDASA